MSSAVPPVGPAKPRIWPLTLLLVLFAATLTAYQGYEAAGMAGTAIVSLFFYGDLLSSDIYITSVMACLTTVPAYAAMIWCGAQRGCRLGLWLIAVAAALMVCVGLAVLVIVGDPRDPDLWQLTNLAAMFGPSTWVNWVTAAVFAGVSVTTRLTRRGATAYQIGL